MGTLDPKKSRELLQEIENFIIKRNKSNKKLARDVAEWVDKAVQMSVERLTDTGRASGESGEGDELMLEQIPGVEE